MRNYVEYMSIRRRMQRTQLKSLISNDNLVAIEFSPLLGELPREYLHLDQVLQPYLYLSVNLMLRERYLAFSDCVSALDNHLTLVIREFIRLERQALFADVATKDFLCHFLRQEATLLIRLLLGWQKFLQGNLSMCKMLDRIEDLKIRLQTYRVETRMRECFRDGYLRECKKVVSTFMRASTIKSQADAIRLSFSKNACMQDAMLSQPAINGVNSDAVDRSSEADYIVIDLLNQGLFSAKQLSSRELNDPEFRRESRIADAHMTKQNASLALSVATGLMVGALFVVTDGLIVPFLPVLEFALMEIITIAGCAVVGVGAGILLEHKRETAISSHS